VELIRGATPAGAGAGAGLGVAAEASSESLSSQVERSPPLLPLRAPDDCAMGHLVQGHAFPSRADAGAGGAR
jgi:hypothetical protein